MNGYRNVIHQYYLHATCRAANLYLHNLKLKLTLTPAKIHNDSLMDDEKRLFFT